MDSPTEACALISRLTDSLDMHSQALMLRAERQRLIASNIANADTPGYQARDFDFANALRGASSEAASSGGGIAQDVGRNVATSGGWDSRDGSAYHSTALLRWAVPSQTQLDSNTVDMDRERSAFVDNSVKYESTLRFINSGVRNLLDAMKSFHQA
jgi:flagellar basal-body rod protein FlgB